MAIISNLINKMINKHQIEQIIELKKQHTTQEVSKKLQIPYGTIRYWIKRLKFENIPIINQKSGRKPLSLK